MSNSFLGITRTALTHGSPRQVQELGSPVAGPATVRRGHLRLALLSFAGFFGLAGCGSGGAGDSGSSPIAGGRWSDPTTWSGGVVPQANDNVFIEAGQTVVLDTTTPPLDQLRIEGTLVADPLVDVGVTANTIEVMGTGTLQVGTESEPYTQTATFTLTGPRGTHTPRAEDGGLDNDGVQRAIRVENGGSLKLFGATPAVLQTKLAAHAPAASTTFTLADPVAWRAGDRVAVSITDFFGVGQTEILTVAADTTGAAMQTTSGIQTSRWGLLQYPTDTTVGGSAVSLSPGAFTPASTSTATVLDERAEVVNLSRRIVIQGADDADWTNQGFGVHVMVMGRTSTAQVRGVEFRRCGQRGAMGRYPFHWHMLSYTAANAAGQGGGQYLGDVEGANHFLTNSSIWNSENRAVTIHGTCGVTVQGTFAVDIKGHAFFLEDGSEQRNTLSGCVAMKVRDPGNGRRLKLHDEDASGFWLTNPDNTIVGNSASDCSGRGLWNSFATRCFGLSRNAAIEPIYIVIRQFDDNTGHSNGAQGLMTDNIVLDEAGTIGGQRYLERYTAGQVTEFFMRRNKTWKNNQGGYQNRVMRAQYLDWTAADNNGRDFQGSSLGGALMSGTLLIGKSLNSATPFVEPRRTALASYHHQMDFVNITAVNYPYVAPTMTPGGQFVYGGGVFDSSDLYTYSVGLGSYRNTGWRLINSHAGYLTPAPYFDGFPLQVGPNLYRYWSLPGAVWDPHGYWGPAGNYVAHDHPFYTYGLSSSVPVAPAGTQRVSTPDPFYGVDLIVVDHDQQFGSSLRVMRVGRLNNSNVEIAEHTVGAPSQSVFFSGMRHFTLAKNGRYRMTFPGESLPTTSLTMELYNAYRATDSFLLGLPWPGNIPVGGKVQSGYGVDPSTGVAQGRLRYFSRTGNSIADVLASPTGSVIWQDTANNTVWMKHVGGLNWVIDAYHGGPESDTNLARPQLLYFYPSP